MIPEKHRPYGSLGRRWVHLLVAVAFVALVYFAPFPTESLSLPGRMSLGLLVTAVYLWVTRPIPLAITALLSMVALPVFGVLPLADTWASWISNVIFFVLASFALTTGLLNTSIPTRVVYLLLRLAGPSSSRIILAFMAACAICSAFISDLPCTAVFAGIAMSTIIEIQAEEPSRSGLAKCLMIGISFGSMIGGMATPIGTAMNIMIVGMLEAATGVKITFLQWILMALPLSIVMLPVAWFSLTRLFKPEPLSAKTAAILKEKTEHLPKLNAQDKKMLAILCTLMGAWVAGNWTGWDGSAICVIGMILLFLPGIDLITWEQYVKGVSWEVVMVIGGVQSIAAGISAQGASSWLVTSIFSKAALSATALLAGVSAVIPLLRLVIPVAPAMIAITLVPLVQMAQDVGLSVVVIALIIALEGNTFLLALDNNVMMSYRYGCYSIGDYFKAGLIPTFALAMLCTTVLPLLAAAIGY